MGVLESACIFHYVFTIRRNDPELCVEYLLFAQLNSEFLLKLASVVHKVNSILLT